MIGAIAILSILLIGSMTLNCHLIDTLHKLDAQIDEDDICWGWTNDLVKENDRLNRENAELRIRLNISEGAFDDVREELE